MPQADARELLLLATIPALNPYLGWRRMLEIVAHAWYKGDPKGALAVATAPTYGQLKGQEGADVISYAEDDRLFASSESPAAGYVPFLLDEANKIVLFALQMEQCPVCNVYMLPEGEYSRLFPLRADMGLRAQLARAHWQPRSTVYDDTRETYICQRCAKEGKLTFTCALCNEVRQSNESQLARGMPAEHLCKSCYATVPAKQWDEAVARLEERHKFDHL